MSEHHIFSIVPVEMIKDDRLNKNDFKVLIAILSFRNKNTNLCMPSREKLSERCHLPVNKISAITGRLVNLGWLEKEGKGGFGKSCRYTFKVPDFLDETLPKTVTVTETETLPKTVTVTETETLPKTVTVNGKQPYPKQVGDTLPKTVTPTLPVLGRGKEHTNITNNLNNNSNSIVREENEKSVVVGDFGKKEKIPELPRYTDGKNSDPKTVQEWESYFVNEKGFSFAEAKTSKAYEMYSSWVEKGVTRNDIELATLDVNNSGQTPRYPTYYRTFVEQIMDRKQTQVKSTHKGTVKIPKHNLEKTQAILKTYKSWEPSEEQTRRQGLTGMKEILKNGFPRSST
jgi:hypothetical protein